MDIKNLFEKHPNWQAIVETSEKLHSAGFKVYLAGGCVRDALMGRTAHDFDLASSARPDDVLKIFPNAVDVGRAFGVMIIPFDGFQIEVTTFRQDGDYLDGRHPVSVEFSEPELDAQRRDFTINGLFYDLKSGEIIDYVSGREDIGQKVIRAIGDPYARFKDDKLRMLRAARFSAQLGFDVDEATLKAMSALSPEISQVSKERITEEFKKLSRSQNPAKGFQILKATGLFAKIFPSLSFVESESWGLFLRSQAELSPIGSIELLSASIVLFETLFSGAQKDTESRGAQNDNSHGEVNWQDLPFILSRESKREIQFLVHGFFAVREGRDEALLLLNEEAGPLLTELCSVFARLRLFPFEKTGALIDRFLKVSDLNGHLPKAFLSGDDLLKLGVRPSAEMGELLKKNYMAQIKGEIKSKNEALAWVRKRL